MTPLFTANQEMFFVVLTMVFIVAIIGDFSKARFFRSIGRMPDTRNKLDKVTKLFMVLLIVFMAWAQDKDSQQSSGNGDWLSGSTLESMEGGYTSMTEGGSTGITWAVRTGLPPFTSNAVLTASQYLAGVACVCVTNIQPSALDAPTDAVAYTNWPYAVARHSVLLPQGCLPEGFTFGGRAVSNLYVAASGMLSFDSPKSSPTPATNGIPDGTAANYIAVLQTPSDIVPTNGLFWYVTGTNSSLFTWKDVYLGQDTNCLATVQAELYADGDFTCRYYFPSATNNYSQLTNFFLVGAQNNSGGETVLHTNALLAIHPSFLPAFELRWKAFGDLLTGALVENDFDADDLSDLDELRLDTDPRNPDSDGDAIMDGEEISLYGTDPNAFSSDASGQGDLWRMLGGLGPSDAPDTSAMPSESVGILTVTTRLENAAANGAAILRIGNHHIPVLAGTTLVSRIAIPRDATILFILARGVNCDNAIAHITIDASTFTKIRDPSGALSGSFTLSPSCVNASGTVLMPAYAITPAVVCFHSPTSSVLRIESADPDIYFNTGQGLVREYTPSKPSDLPPCFTIGAITGRLACAGSVFTLLEDQFTKAAHFCNTDGPGGWEDPDDPDDREDWYCHTDAYGHVVDDPYTESDCPCIIIYENAYDCHCSGRGVSPCPCGHAVCDPHATPADEPHDGPPYKSTREHATLEIGKDAALFPVAVPQGEYEPCPRCTCGMNQPLCAYAFRQTGNIDVAPSSLYTNGSFAVTGIHPSTNFAAEVLTVHLKDTYIQQSYTVLGTSVCPADTGHSVSNWFIGCGITNALTLWTGVKLPSDTGEVTLSVTVENGTPGPQLYVYNRIAQSNELLASQGNLTFTQNLGDWRDTYCDTNGFTQAYLLCARGGAGSVTHSYTTYSGQPYSLSCDAEQRFTVWEVDLDADTDRDGDIDSDDDAGEDAWTLLRGALVLPYAVDLFTTQDMPYTNLSRIAITCSNTPPGTTFRLKAADSETEKGLTFVDAGGVGDAFNMDGVLVVTQCPTNLYVASSEPRKTTQNMPVRFTVDLEALYMGQVVAKDRVLLAVAPVILPPECNEAETVYATRADLAGLIQGLELIPSIIDQWTQDQVKFVKTQHAAGTNADLAVTLGHVNADNIEHILRHTNGMPYFQWPVNGQGGNMMATPPLGADAPYGKLMLGTKNLQSQSRWVAQGIQPVVAISNDWLCVGHVDEILMWAAPDKVLFADPWKAADLLHGEIAAGRETGGLWFGVDATGTNRTIREVVIATNSSAYKIAQIASPLPASSDPTNVVFSVPLFESGDILRVDDEIFVLQSVSANGLTGMVARAQADRPPAAHTNGSVIYAYSAVMRANLITVVGAESIVSRIGMATNQLYQALDGYSADFVPMPVLFQYVELPGGNGYAAGSANVVNCLNGLDGTVYYSKTGCVAFRDYISTVLPDAEEVDNIWCFLHCNYGEVHCATAARRKLDSLPPWWLLVNNWE